jgi:proteasome lid subunit RPN8/RPN11
MFELFRRIKPMSRRFRGKKLRNLVEENGNWYNVSERPAPTNEEITKAVIAHNLSYKTEPIRSHDSQQIHQPWWGSNRQLPTSYRNVPITVKEPPKNDTWTCAIKDVSGCPIAVTPQVRVPNEMYQAWTELAGEFNTEWMAYLIGTFDPSTGDAEITEMYFPPQSASGAHVEMPDENFRARPGTIAAVHSHVRMDAFFSETDTAHANWPVEIVINARGESKMAARIKLECGRYSRVDGKVLLIGVRAADLYRDQLKSAFVEKEKGSGTRMSSISDGEYEGFMYS